MAIRNWWIKIDVDGRKNQVRLGPRCKDGGFSIDIYQRKDGESVLALSVYGEVREDMLVLYADFPFEETSKVLETRR